jgi:hypothetical protein
MKQKAFIKTQVLKRSQGNSPLDLSWIQTEEIDEVRPEPGKQTYKSFHVDSKQRE